MKKWTAVDTALTPDGRTLSLYEHDGGYSIRVGAAELMSTRQHASEERLSQLACAGLHDKRNARVLIGGLGLGFTLKSALAALAPDASAIVAEIVPAVVAWNRNRELPFAADALADRRVTVVAQDVVESIRQPGSLFDAIILDVDNGPAALTAEGNGRLYDYAGLRRTHAALRPGGRVAIWSSAPDAPFEKLMVRAGFAVGSHRCRARDAGGGWHTIFLGQVR